VTKFTGGRGSILDLARPYRDIGLEESTPPDRVIPVTPAFLGGRTAPISAGGSLDAASDDLMRTPVWHEIKKGETYD